ncbi:hypothetical protein [Clostridium intestinale]|uniref:DUF7660 family protein n=1 Tax=Clostridium intestinale TaxID=36845 RepID=UPI0028E623AE|nr:hypothetical protein [Clostridium intestinale]
MNLGEMILNINNKNDLVRFMGILRDDLRNNSDTWTNINLNDYLEAMQSWIEDIEGWEKTCKIDVSKISHWQLVAHILLASKMYE